MEKCYDEICQYTISNMEQKDDMPSKAKKSKTLEQLYGDELKDLYDAENRIVKTLPKLAKASSSAELKDAFEEHLEKSKEHLERLKQIFESMNKNPTAKTCNGIKGIIEEGSKILELEDGPAKDAGLIAGAQRVEHYEMAAYGTIRTWAQQMGRQDDADLLQQTLDEEKEADEKLSQIAQNINAAAEKENETGKQEEEEKSTVSIRR
jgi:ferritin-like metal-binding protein YciE